jgi:hypothetical protein
VADERTLPPRIREHLARLFPGFRVAEVEPLAPDTGATRGVTAKAAGYSQPVRIRLIGGDRDGAPGGGEVRELVWRAASANEFGHDRRADRVDNLVLAYEDFPRVPQHVPAVDVGLIGADGTLISLRDAGEPYLVTGFVRGTIYADDLRRIARDRVATELDVVRTVELGRYLARLHTRIDDPVRYRRAIRDLVGHGEGVFGIIDGYPPGVRGAPEDVLCSIERRCVEWRWRLRGHEGRLVRTHGDFHPFNIVFDEGADFTLLDASRGACGDPADDVTALAINYMLFALDEPAAWRRGLGILWHMLWRTYLRERPDESLLACAPPFFAWRALVLCNPRFYPALTPGARAALLGLAEGALVAGHFDPGWADELWP